MKFKFALLAGVVTLSASVAVPANAALLNFVLSGSRDATFQLDSNPIPTSFSSSTLIGDQIQFVGVNGVFGGVPGTADINFGTNLIATLNIGSASLGFTQFNGPELFSGPASAPVFATGTFALNSIGSGSSTLTISAAPLAAVPEPTSWALMIAGFGLTGAALRRRRIGLAVA